MKHYSIFLVTLTLFFASAFTVYQSVDWTIEEGYSIEFISENPAGIFKNLEGEIQFSPEQLDDSFFNMKVEVTSISTGNGMKNKHAISDKWFDVEN